MDRVTIKYRDLMELLKAYNGGIILKEAKKVAKKIGDGKIYIVDDSGRTVGEIPVMED